MKIGETARTKEILNNYYQNSKMPVWVYDKNMQLLFTNFTNAVLLHLMDAVRITVEKYNKEASYLDYMKLYGNSNEAYLCFQVALDRRHVDTVVIGPALLTYPSEEIWEDLSFHKYVWSNRREETMNLIPVVTLEAFLLNARFIMQSFGIYHLNPLQIADSAPITNYFYHEGANLIAEGRRPEFYSVKQAHEIEEELAFHIRKGNADRVDEIMTQRDRVALLLPAESQRENFISAVALLSTGRSASIAGGMRSEAAYGLFRSYATQLQSCNQMLEFYRLTHNALCAFAEGVQAVAVQMLDTYSDSIRSCIRLIYAHMPGKVTVDELSEEIHLTPKYLSALFCRETGTSLTNFITGIRIEHACRMLESTDLTYLEISAMLDFCSQSHFTASFKKTVGITPREYRLKNKH